MTEIKIDVPLQRFQLDLIRWAIFGAFTKESNDVVANGRFKSIPCKKNYSSMKMGYGPYYTLSLSLSDVEADEYLQIG